MKKGFFSKLFTLIVLGGLIFAGVKYKDECIFQLKKIPGAYYIFQGDRELKRDNLHQAIVYYEKGLKLFPTHKRAWCNWGNILVLYEDYYNATEKYREGLKNTNKYFECRINLGIVLSEKLLEYDDAIAQYEKVVTGPVPVFTIPYFTRDKKTARENQGLAYYNMGLAYKGKSSLAADNKLLANHYLEKSAEMYKKALTLLDKNYDAAYNYALTNHLLGNTYEAKKAYCQAISFSPMNYEAHYNLAILLKNEKDYKAALDEIEKANLILDYVGDPNISRYVFDIMNEITQKILLTQDGNDYLIERFDRNFEKFKKDIKVTYVKGKMVIPDEFNDAMLKNFQTCSINDTI